MYVILSRFSPEAFREPKEFTKLANIVSRVEADERGIPAVGGPTCH